MDQLLEDLKLELELDIVDESKDKLLRKFIRDSIKSILRYINNPKKYTEEIITSSFDDVIIELSKRAYFKFILKKDYGIKSKTQGQRSVTYNNDVSSSPYLITTDLKILLPGPFISVL